MRLINIFLGLLFIFLGTNQIFNYLPFSIPGIFLGIGLIVIGIIFFISSLSFHKNFSVKKGISKETSQTKVKGTNIFLAILSIAGGGSYFILGMGLYFPIVMIILGLLFLLIKPKKVKKS